MTEQLVLRVDDLSTLMPDLNLTVRKDAEKYRDLSTDDAVTVSDGMHAVNGDVRSLYRCQFHNIYPHWLKDEHDVKDRTLAGLFGSMCAYYPGFTLETDVVLIWFRVLTSKGGWRD